MATYTPNYNLKRPDRTDNFAVADANGNMDLLDTALKNVADTAYQKPETGIPENDLSEDVQEKLNEVGTGMPVSPNDGGAYLGTGSSWQQMFFMTVFDCYDRSSALDNAKGVDGDKAVVRNSGNQRYDLYTKTGGVWVQGEIIGSFGQMNDKLFKLTNSERSGLYAKATGSSGYFVFDNMITDDVRRAWSNILSIPVTQEDGTTAELSDFTGDNLLSKGYFDANKGSGGTSPGWDTTGNYHLLFPHLWPASHELDFGNGLFGIRVNGTYNLSGSGQGSVAIKSDGVAVKKVGIVNSGGFASSTYVGTAPPAYSRVGLSGGNSSSTTTSTFFASFISEVSGNDTSGPLILRLKSSSSTAMSDLPYDVWCTYTKIT